MVEVEGYCGDFSDVNLFVGDAEECVVPVLRRASEVERCGSDVEDVDLAAVVAVSPAQSLEAAALKVRVPHVSLVLGQQYSAAQGDILSARLVSRGLCACSTYDTGLDVPAFPWTASDHDACLHRVERGVCALAVIVRHGTAERHPYRLWYDWQSTYVQFVEWASSSQSDHDVPRACSNRANDVRNARLQVGGWYVPVCEYRVHDVICCHWLSVVECQVLPEHPCLGCPVVH